MLEFALKFIHDFWGTVCEMSVYLLFGFFAAGVLSVLISPRLVERHLGGGGIWQVIKASLFGVPLPLCSCGVIPVSMSLRKHGAGKGATVSFLISTPQTGVDSIFVTFSLLGVVYAVFRPIVAFVSGIVGGVMVNIFDSGDGERAEEKCSDECCQPGQKKRNVIARIWEYGFVILPKDIGKPMLGGLVIAAIISAVVPGNFFADKLGTGIIPMIVMMCIGIPIYVCATASVPIAAALIAAGISPGAALVFLMTGPATNAAAFATIWKVLGGKTAFLYLISVAVCALVAGLLLDAMFPNLGSSIEASHVHAASPQAYKHAAAVILLAVLGYSMFSRKKISQGT